MAVSWLQTASLLVLVVALCPGIEAFNAQHLCGSHLVEAMNMVCGDRGFYYNPRRDIDPLMNLFPVKVRKAGAQGENDVSLKEQMEMMVKRGIVEECCDNPCPLLALEKYCN